MRSTILLSLLALASFMGCGDKGNGDGSDGDDTGGDDTGQAEGDGGSYEVGCITVDGSGGYARLADALAVASEGSVVSLAPCTGTLTEAVEIEKSLTLEGGDSVVLTADDDNPLTIQSDGVTVRDLQIEGGEHGIDVEQITGLTLSNVSITGSSGWGLRVNKAEDLTVTGLTITGAASGGIRLKGGTAQLSGLEISDVYGYGLRLYTSAEASLAGSTIRSVGASSSEDGMAVSVETSTLTSSSNTLEGAAAWNLYGSAATITSTGDSFTEGTMGVLAQDTTLTLTDATITNPQWCGIYAYSSGTQPVVVDGANVLFEEGAVAEVDPDTWGDQAYVGAGIFLIADDVAVSNSTVTGTGGVGMLVAGATSASATLDNIQVSDVDQYGLYLSSGDFVATELSVSGVRAFETDEDSRCTSVDQDVGVVLIEGTLDWTGGGVSESEGYGLSAVFGDAVVDELTVADNGCAGIMGFGGSLEVTDSDFSGAAGESFTAALTTYEGTGLVATGNSFHDDSAELFDWSYDYGGGARTDYYAWFGSDIQLFYGGHAVIEDNSFDNGVNGVEVYSDASYGYSTAALSRNSFTDYKGFTVLAYAGSEVSATDHSVDGYGLSPVYCQDASLTLEDVSVSDGGILSERYEVYTHDKLTDTGAFTSYGPAVYASECDFSANGLTVSDADAWGVYLEGGSNQITSLGIDSAGTAADADGLSIYASSTTASLDLATAEITQSDRYGLVAYASGSASLDLSVSGAQVDSSGVVEVLLQNDSPTSATAEAVIQSSTFTDSAAVGLYSQDFALQLDNVTAGNNASDGFYLDGGQAQIKSSTAYDNGGYGLYCDSEVEFSACDLTFSGNASGDSSGCDSLCSGDIGDTGDTGIE